MTALVVAVLTIRLAWHVFRRFRDRVDLVRPVVTLMALIAAQITLGAFVVLTGKDPLINQTKQQIAARLYTVGRNPIFNQMFSAPDNKFNAYACMQEKKIVLINTDRLFLGDEASGVFGRFIIAQCLAAALSRATLPERDRHLALLVVDLLAGR